MSKRPGYQIWASNSEVVQTDHLNETDVIFELKPENCPIVCISLAFSDRSKVYELAGRLIQAANRMEQREGD